MTATALESFLMRYDDLNRSGVIDQATISSHKMLFRVIRNILKRDTLKGVSNGMDLILKYIEGDSYVGFSKVNLFRFKHYWRWSRAEIEAMDTLMILTISLCGVRKTKTHNINFESLYDSRYVSSVETSALETYLKSLVV